MNFESRGNKRVVSPTKDVRCSPSHSDVSVVHCAGTGSVSSVRKIFRRKIIVSLAELL